MKKEIIMTYEDMIYECNKIDEELNELEKQIKEDYDPEDPETFRIQMSKRCSRLKYYKAMLDIEML